MEESLIPFKMKDRIGIAKRNIKKGEVFQVPINLMTGEILPNKYINFIHGTTIHQLKKR